MQVASRSRWFRAAVVPLVLAAGLVAQSTPPSQPAKKAAKPAKATVTAEDVQALKDALAAQQKQIQELRQEMHGREAALQSAQQQAQSAQQQLQQAQASAADAQQKAAAAESTAAAQKDAVGKLTVDLADVKTTLTSTAASEQEEQKRTSALEALAGRFRLSGDVRVRGESYFQDGVPDRNRARIRVRFGVDGQLNEDFIAGIAVATGSLGDPSSTNETLTNNFDRKTIGLDRGFITYNPVAHRWLSITGGKWAYSWQRTSVTFDPDLNPEGFNEKASFDLNGPVVKNFTVQAIQLLYNEVAGSVGNTASQAQDSYAVGAQVSTKLQLGIWTATPSFLSLKWNRPDAILQSSAFAVGATTTGYQPATPKGGSKPSPITGIPVPGEGQGCAKALNAPSFAPCVFAPNGMTNATYVDSKGNLHFYSGYNYADFILPNQFKTGYARLPINLQLEFLENLDAEDHPLSSKGSVLKNLGSQNKEYGLDFSVGQTKNKNDIQVGYAWYREEQDAAIASFVESDQRAPTNVLQNRFYGLWKLRANTLASFSWWHGRTLDSFLENNAASTNKTISKAGDTEPSLNRLQFDLIYTF